MCSVGNENRIIPMKDKNPADFGPWFMSIIFHVSRIYTWMTRFWDKLIVEIWM
jgi:hypothetical protein